MGNAVGQPNDSLIAMQDLAALLKGICGEKFVFTDREYLLDYETDQTMNLRYPFDILIKPAFAREISEILKICNQYNIPVTPRGGGSGVTGGALPVMGGVVLSLERLNRIVCINKLESYVIAESGVVTADLCKAVEEDGLYFTVLPSSGAYSFVGGNVAENAGAINSCKYGNIGAYVLNMEVVLPTGEIIWTGANVSKSATGLNLTPFFVGSEGILGIITQVVLRLLPPCLPEVQLLASFNNLENACNAVQDIKGACLSPAAVELIGKNAITMTAGFLAEPLPLVTPDVTAHLLIGLQEYHPDVLHRSLEQLVMLIAKYTDNDVLVAETTLEKEQLSKLRFNIGNAMTSGGRNYRDIDACVPVGALYNYIRRVEDICGENNLSLVFFGHAFDGNLHTMIVMDETQLTGQAPTLDKAVDEIYEYAISLGGVISGEHGIGSLQKPYLKWQFNPTQLSLMRRLKSFFDPNGILNPGKIL